MAWAPGPAQQRILVLDVMNLRVLLTYSELHGQSDFIPAICRSYGPVRGKAFLVLN
jgi:hypothetical protein